MSLERKLRRKNGLPTQTRPSRKLCIAWYSPEQYNRLLEVADDREQIRDTYENWLRGAEKVVQDLPVRPTIVHIKVDELVRWCQAHKRPVDSEARSEYARLMGENLS